MTFRWLRLSAISLITAVLAILNFAHQKKYDPGATDTEIKIGNFLPYTGIFSEYGAVGRAESAYFQMINDRGGINGRKINFVTLDSQSDYRNARDLARKLVEQERVLLTISIWGTPSNKEIRPYMNEKKVPQLFVAANDNEFNDPSHFPWTMGFTPSNRVEGAAYAKYILQIKPDAKVAVLYSNDDQGREWLRGIHDVLGEKSLPPPVKEIAFDYSDTGGLESPVTALKDSGANVFLNMLVGRFATEAIRKAYDIGWHPLQFIPNADISISAFIEPAGLQKSVGIITNARSKDWLLPESRFDAAVREYLDWLHKYEPEANVRDANNLFGYEIAQTVVEVLKNCGDELTRENVLKQATHLDLELGMLRPGIKITTSPQDYRPIKQLFLVKFNGKGWDAVGDVITAD
jgi:branched-chain amino acid transport system substrate-binding protein